MTETEYPAGSLSARYADSYVAKFEDPFTAFLYQVSLDGCDNETGSVDDLGYWIGQLGRYVLVEDSNGAVWASRVLADRQASTFYAWVEQYVGADDTDEEG
jgi:hypothetical protein